MITSCYIEFLTLTICILLAIIVNLVGEENVDAIVFLIFFFGVFMFLSVVSNAEICKTFMDKYLNQSCPGYIKLIIALVGSFGLPAIVTGIIVFITVYIWNHKKKG